MKQAKVVALSTLLTLGAASANATVIIFDGNNGGAKAGTVETASGANSGPLENPDVWGPTLTFSDFTVEGGLSNGDNLNTGTFLRGDITPYNVDQDLSPNHGGLGVCSESKICGGDSDSFSSNFGNNAGYDEVLFFDFNSAVTLETVWFNGDHKESVDGDTSIAKNDPLNALFNIYVSTDGITYNNIFPDQVQPTDLEYIDTLLGASSYQYYAVAASGWGPHASYIEAIKYVPEPATLSLLGLGLVGLGVRRRQRKS